MISTNNTPNNSIVSYFKRFFGIKIWILIYLFTLVEVFHFLLPSSPLGLQWRSDYYYKQNFVGVFFLILCVSYTSCLQVADLLGKYPDLMEGFNEFLERCERIGSC